MIVEPVILIVEDSDYVRELYTSVLADLGNCLAFDGVREALPFLPQADFVLTDLMMPHLTGLDLLNHLRAHGLGVPALVVTAAGPEDEDVRELQRRGVPVMFKPFRVQDLRTLVWRMIQDSGSQGLRAASM